MKPAVDAGDPDAAIAAGGSWSLVFVGTRYDGKPIALKQRKRKLHAQSLRMLRDVEVTGRYQLGNHGALVFKACDGFGWITHGAVLMWREADACDISGKQIVSNPPN